MDGSPQHSTGRLARAVTAVSVLVVSVLLWNGLSGTIPFDSDEANHAVIGLRQYQDLASGRWMDFVRHSYRTGQFPFLHGWTLVPFYALFGTTLEAARMAGVFAFAAGAFATGHLAYRLHDDVRAGAAAAVLFATSPYMAAQAGVCMLEVPGAAATAIALALFVEGFHRSDAQRRWWPGLVAVAVLATYFIKLNFGLWVAPAIGGTWVLLALRPDRRRESLRSLALYLGVLVVVGVIWYSTEAQRAAFSEFLNNPSELVPVEEDEPGFKLPSLSWGNFSGYFGLIADDYHLHWTLGTATLLAALAGFFRRRLLERPGLIACGLLIGWTWFVLSMGFREYTLARFIATALPAIWAVAAWIVPALAERLPSPRVAAGLGVLAAAGSVGAAVVVVPPAQQAEYEIDERFNPYFDFVAEQIPDRASVMVINYTDRTTARHIGWLLSTRPGALYDTNDVKGYLGERVFASDRPVREWLTRDRPWGASDWGSYIVDVDLRPEYLDYGRVVPETVAMFRAVLTELGPRLELVAERDFPELGLSVRVLRDTEPPRHLGVDPRKRQSD